MSETSVIQKDFLDIASNYFVNVKPREFFKTIHQMVFWNKYLTGKEAQSLTTGIKTFMGVFDAFNILDVMDNVNNLRNHMLGKDVKDLSLLVSDTVNSVCETTTWLAITTGIISLSANTLSWVMSGSGITLMFSFAKNTVKEIKDLIKRPLTKDEKNIKMFTIAKNIALFAIGVILFACGWFGYPLRISLLTFLGSVTIISNFAIHLIENNQKTHAT